MRNKEDFRGKRLLVVGGGDSALDWALGLLDYASHITLIHRRDGFRAHEDSVKKLFASPIETKLFYELRALRGDDRVREAVVYQNKTQQEEVIPVDAVLAFLELENGIPCTFATVSYRDTPNAGVEAHGVEILCTDGMVKVDQRRRVYVSRAGKYEEVPVPREESVRTEWDAFAESIEHGGPPPVPLAHARHIVAVMEACEESTASGRTIQL